MLDIDHFKNVNDTHGHDCGDTVLVRVAKTLEQSIRYQDMVARWGGEEFICLLPETDLEGGVYVAEKIRKLVSADSHKCSSGDVGVTVTLGARIYNGNYSLDECIGQADAALYKGKKQGRNQINYEE